MTEIEVQRSKVVHASVLLRSLSERNIISKPEGLLAQPIKRLRPMFESYPGGICPDENTIIGHESPHVEGHLSMKLVACTPNRDNICQYSRF